MLEGYRRTVKIVRRRKNASHRHTDTGILAHGCDDVDHPKGVLVGGGAVHDTDVEHLQHTGGVRVRIGVGYGDKPWTLEIRFLS